MVEQPIIKVRDVAFPRLRVPDLDAMESFLADFGMTLVARTPEVMYFRGIGRAPFLEVVHRGEPGFIGFALEAASREDLDRIAASEGFSPVSFLDAPGGGWSTYTTDPVGMRVEVVFGRSNFDAEAGYRPRPMNVGRHLERIGQTQRIPLGPSRIKRFGHLGFNVSDPVAMLHWYQARFGLIPSDRLHMTPGDNTAIFVRCDRGSEPTDHHSLLFASTLLSAGAVGLNHISFEVFDIDDVISGGEYLSTRNRRHEWGVGRHLLGSQIFDYWRDPWGHIHEHWTDGDQFDASEPVGDHDLRVAATSQWGPHMPPTFGHN